MASIIADQPPPSPAGAGLFSKERIVAGPAFNRWLVPPAALAIHLCIGMAYGFSVFWLPMSHLVASPDAVACTDLGFWSAMTTTTCNWSVAQVTHIFETFIAMLGISAALWGGWLEHAGPRKAGFIAALCWGGGLVVGGIGVSIHQLWLVYLGCGVLGGVGQGLGYISPVSTLIKWFPDRRGMATGFAIMGYGGGAMIGAPLAVALMKNFSATSAQGVAPTLIAMGVLYFVVMAAGAFGFRVAPSGWRPTGWTPPDGDERERDDHAASRSPVAGLEDTAVLAHLGGAVPERDGRHRRHLDGEPDVPGSVRREAARRRRAARSTRGRRRRSSRRRPASSG